jgi:hypothetical protein
MIKQALEHRKKSYHLDSKGQQFIPNAIKHGENSNLEMIITIEQHSNPIDLKKGKNHINN